MKPLLALAAACLLFATGCNKKKTTDADRSADTDRSTDIRPPGVRQARPADAKRDVITREEFLDAVMGKSADAVLKAVGPPDDTSGVGTSDTVWIYKNRTRDVATGKTDPAAHVHFGLGGVGHVCGVVKVDF
jgi:hypothetical protein